jgi:hypothetical protein
MSEIKRDLKVCPDYEDGEEAYIIEPRNTWADVMRFIQKDVGSHELVYLANRIAEEAGFDDE